MVYARRLPSRSLRHAHQVGIEELISAKISWTASMRKPMATPELLSALLTASGPSGHEEEPARVWREAAAAFAEVTSDTLGSSFARVRAGGVRQVAN